MTRSYRNNNPGNLEYGDISKKWGAVQEKGQGRFARFSYPCFGVCALAHLLTKEYRDLTLESAMLKYAPQAENNTAKYIQFLCSKVGVKKEALIKDLDALQFISLLGAITIFEGYSK